MAVSPGFLKRLTSSKWFFAVYLLIASTLPLEIGLRVYFSTQSGNRVLFYGTPWYRNDLEPERVKALKRAHDTGGRDYLSWNQEASEQSVEKHRAGSAAYTKYFPNERKTHLDVDTKEVFSIHINSQGFRGPEYTKEKAPGVIRILTLGSSSTFGFYNRDNETYPYYLAQELRRRCPGREFEVINLAVPHAFSSNIRALFLTEGIALNPDVVTFYEGRNDSASWDHEMTNVVSDSSPASGLVSKIRQSIAGRLLLVRLLEQTLESRSRMTVSQILESLDVESTAKTSGFLKNLSSILAACREHGIRLVVATQQANSKAIFGAPKEERLKQKGITYSDEVNQILNAVDRGESITGYEYNFLIHDRLMKALRKWSAENKVPLVDIIHALDQDRHYLLTWVHLHPEANKKIAAELATEILKGSCPEPIPATATPPLR